MVTSKQTRADRAREALVNAGAVLLDKIKGPGVNSTLYVYSLQGWVRILQVFHNIDDSEDDGFEIYKTVCKDNRIDATIEAALDVSNG